jgi:hypothetical protein
MYHDKQDILEFLSKFDCFVSPVEIAKKVGGKQRFKEDRDWAKPILYRLFMEGVLEADEYGHYRLKPESKTKDKAAGPKCYYSFGCKTYILDDDEPFAIALNAFRPNQHR